MKYFVDEYILKSTRVKFGEQFMELSEVAITNSETLWSDGVIGSRSKEELGATPKENFFSVYDLRMYPVSSPPYSQSVFRFGYGGLSEKDIKQALIELATTI